MPVRVKFVVVLCFLAQPSHAETTQFGEGDNAFTIEFVEIGDPGNPDDPRVRLARPDAPAATSEIWPAGAVDYEFGISKFEISLEIVKLVDDLAGIGVRLTQGYGERRNRRLFQRADPR